jgi:hypothetical protein
LSRETVATVPFNVYGQLPAEALAGKIVIDTMNYYPERAGLAPERCQKRGTVVWPDEPASRATFASPRVRCQKTGVLCHGLL